MPEETETVEEVEQTEPTEQVEQPEAETVEAAAEEETAEYWKNKYQNKQDEAARLHKKVDKFETDAAERKKAEMSETERLQAELAEAQSKAKDLETRQAQNEAAVKVGLPLVFADRLKGETPEELEADAKALLASMPKQTAKPIKGMAPGDGSPTEMTDAQRREFLGLNGY